MPNDLVKLLLLAAVAYVAYNVLLGDGSLVKNSGVMHTELSKLEKTVLDATGASGASAHKKVEHSQVDDVYQNNPNVLPHPQISNNYSPQGQFDPNSAHNFAQLDCFPKDQLMASDLLPPEGGFSESNPATQGQLMNRNLFESGHHGGLNTQLSSLKNANRQLRSDPEIPRLDVGPWHQSTYEADTNRRSFEIGSA